MGRKVPERSKIFEDYFANGLKDHRNESELYWEIVSRHPSWSLARVLPRLNMRIDEVDAEEIAREFESLVQGKKEISRPSLIASLRLQTLKGASSR